MPRYLEKVAQGLTNARAQSSVEQVEISDLRLVVLGDQHRGAGDGADDFRLCRQIYHGALGHYYRSGHTLVMPGDVEELWERSAEKIVEEYRGTLELERRFLNDGRYIRLIGNHDELLRKKSVFDVFAPYLTRQGNETPERIHDAYRFRVMDEGRFLGEIFLAHGHQGVNYNWYAVAAVKYFWTWIQKLSGVGYGIPSSHFEMRCKHERAMHSWASGLEESVAFLAGHTHFPVFMSENPINAAKKDLEELLGRENASAEELAKAESAFQFVLAETRPGAGAIEGSDIPCYFNAGCCSFTGGEVTGIEIADGQMRLVRWDGGDGQPVRTELRSAPLHEVFEKITEAKEEGD